jgi:hypothetical protein
VAGKHTNESEHGAWGCKVHEIPPERKSELEFVRREEPSIQIQNSGSEDEVAKMQPNPKLEHIKRMTAELGKASQGRGSSYSGGGEASRINCFEK